ncbi:Toluene tolerance family protein [Syntrophobacter sp. SbD1]|nr:Toluene tolerance family protein [Syntrophobacter sp. SbD1]
MSRFRVFFFLFACLSIVLAAAKPLRAQSDATAQVRSVLDKAMDIQTKPELQGPEHRKERAAQIRKLISDNFLSEEMAKESLAGYWEKLSAGQRQRYQSLFTGIFTDSYSVRVLDFLKRETIEYPGESPEGKYVKVRTIIMRTNEHIPVDYILENKGRKWMIRDVIIDSVSTVETYHNGFGSFLRNHPFDALIERMAIQKKAGEEL